MHNALTRRTREPSGGPPTLSISSDSASLAIEVLRFIVNLVPLWFSEAVYLDSSASALLTAAECRILSRSKRKTGINDIKLHKDIFSRVWIQCM